MKISSKKYPFLLALAENKPLGSGWCELMSEEHQIKIMSNTEIIEQIWQYLCISAELGEMSIDYVTKPIIAAFDEDEKNAETLHQMRDQVPNCQGAYLVAGTNFGHVYVVMNSEEERKVSVSVFTFMGNMLVGFTNCMWEYGTFPDYYMKIDESFYLGHSYDVKEFAYGIQTVVTYEIFKETVNIQHKEIDGSGVSAPNKLGKTRKDKIISDIPLNVRIMDSTYFTTISRTGKFKVSGHIRKQRYGKGRSKVRPIWISSFEKSGYTKIARKLKE